MMNEAKKKQIENCNKFLDSHRWLSVWDLDCKVIEYRRNPTEYEIRFGEGAIHYRSFPLKECINSKGEIKKRFWDANTGRWWTR
jgi:hypothetical protein